MMPAGAHRPLSPGGAPRFNLPSGQCGVGRAGGGAPRCAFCPNARTADRATTVTNAKRRTKIRTSCTELYLHRRRCRRYGKMMPHLLVIRTIYLTCVRKVHQENRNTTTQKSCVVKPMTLRNGNANAAE